MREKPPRIPLRAKRCLERLIGKHALREGESKKRVRHAHQDQPQGRSLARREKARGVRASYVRRTRTGHGAGNLRGASRVSSASAQAGLQQRGDGSEGVQYLLSSDVTLDYEQLSTI